MILIITNKEDSHPTPVINYLIEKDIPVFRLNTECLLTDYEFRWWCDEGTTDFYIRNIKNDREIFGHELCAVWERRPEFPNELPLKIRSEIDKHNIKEASEFLSFLLYYVSVKFSIGHHLYDRSAASKMLQYYIACELGMKVPTTIYSNKKEYIVPFVKDYKSVALKPIESSGIWLGDEMEYVFYTRKVETYLLLEQPDEAFLQSVSFIQNYIEKAFELRVTVVCNEVFACKIDSQCMNEDSGRIDWRQGYEYGLKHSIFELPERISCFCRDFLKRLNLNFGCFDFVVTPRNEYVFLECNPNGQWLWIELETGLKISESIARHLMNPIGH